MGDGHEYADYCEHCGHTRGRLRPGPKPAGARRLTKADYWARVSDMASDAVTCSANHFPEAAKLARVYAGHAATSYSSSQVDHILRLVGGNHRHQAEYGEYGDNQEPPSEYDDHVRQLLRAMIFADVMREVEAAFAEDEYGVAL